MSISRIATFIVGSTAAAVTLAGLAATVAAPANAAAKFSAVVYSPATGAWGWAMLAGNQQQAIDVATTYCAGAGGTDCRSAASSAPGGCVSLVRSKTDGGIWFGGAGPSPAEAQGNAYGHIGGGDLLVSTCSGGDGETADPKGAGGLSALPAKPVEAPVVVPPPPPPPPPPPAVAPTDAVRVSFDRSGLNENVTFTNSSDVAGKCSYVASPQGNPFLPTVNKSVSLGANGTASLTVLAPPLLSSYHVVTSCHGTFAGKDVEFGHDEQDVSG